ncbi:MAG: VWA domain-containing protein [Rhodobacteraceae bacterium]|nr:VWA domain-containing protein [Paracoccaceae bacterium]
MRAERATVRPWSACAPITRPTLATGCRLFCVFATNGSTDDKPETARFLRESTAEPMFWEFMGIIKPGAFANRWMSFLEELDDLDVRGIENADFST